MLGQRSANAPARGGTPAPRPKPTDDGYISKKLEFDELLFADAIQLI
jgi:hypothetical protein